MEIENMGNNNKNFGPIQCYSTVHLTDANDLFISQFIIHNSIINIYFFRCARRLCGRHSLNAMHSTSFVVVIVAEFVVSVCVCMARWAYKHKLLEMSASPEKTMATI